MTILENMTIIYCNKKVLLRERKRYTAHRVVALSADLGYLL